MLFFIKLPIYNFLLINLLFSEEFLAAQTLTDPNFEQAFLPFGSASGGRLSSRCVPSSATFTLRNNCPYTVWAAAVPGGGRQLDGGKAWTLNIPPGTRGRVWGRSNCAFDGSGRGKCETGDCDGLLRCESYGAPPNTLAEFALNQFNNMDFFDVSLVDGFNIPLQFRSASNGCDRGVNCSADINGQCPAELRAPGGCNGPCTVFKTDEYCCPKSNCGPTNYSNFFKERCPNAYSYPLDTSDNTFSCPGGTNYDVVFCP